MSKVIIDLLESSIVERNEDVWDYLDQETLSGLSVYQNNFLFGHIKVLKNKYESIYKVLGEENFNFVARDFISNTLPHEENIDDYGLGFDSFLVSKDELKDLIYIKDLALIDQFWFYCHENTNQTLSVMSGVFDLWERLISNVEIKDIEIDVSLKDELIIEKNEEEFFIKRRER